MIPKIVHVAWPTRDIANHPSPIIVNGLRNIIDMNPDWKVTIYTDAEIDQYLRNDLANSDYQSVKSVHMAAKTDIWRLYKMSREGGLYIDIDRLCDRSLNLICAGYRWVLSFTPNFTPSHDVMLSAPNNPVYSEAIKLYWKRRREGNNNTFFLGPQTYAHAVSRVLSGEIMDLYSDGIKTFKDNPPYDTMLWQGDGGFNHEDEKRKLYAEFGLKHWTGEW